MNKVTFTLLSALGILPAVVYSESFTALLEDDADLLLSIRSMAESREAWSDHPFAEVFEDPELQTFLEPLIGPAPDQDDEDSFTEVMENEFGLTWDEFFELFPGEMALVMFNASEMMLDEDDRPDIAIMAEFSGDAERMDELMQVQFERNAAQQKEMNSEIEHTLIEESFMGETLYFDETYNGEETYIEDGYALVDGVFVLATPESRLRSMVEAIKDEPEAPLSENPTYLRSREQGGRGDLSIYINLETMMPPLNQALLEQSMEGGAAMFGLNPQSLNAALSLESLLAIYLDIDLIEDGLSSHSGILYREKVGLLSLVTYDDGPLPEARYVPPSVFSTSVTTFDFGAMLAQLELLLGEASPTLPPLLDMQMQTVRSQTGVDLRTSVLQNLGGNMVSLSTLSTSEKDSAVVHPEQVILLELRDAEAFSGALEALIDMAPGAREFIEVQEFAGETIHTIKGMQDPNMGDSSANDFSYVITRSHFIMNIGSVGLLQNVLTRIESGDNGFWQQGETEDLFEAFAMDGVVSRTYVDLEQMATPILESMVETMAMGAASTPLDRDLIPGDLNVPFHGISQVNEEEDGFFNHSLIILKDTSK